MKATLDAWLAEHPVARRVLGNSGWLMMERLGALSLSLIAGVTVARQLGPEAWGRLQYCIAFVSIFGGMAVLGLNSVVVQELARGECPVGVIMGTALALRTAAAFAMVLVTLVVALFSHASGDPSLLLILVLSTTLVLGVSDVFEWRLMAEQDASALVRSKFPAGVLNALLKLALVLVGAPLLAFAGAEVAGAALLFLTLAWAWKTSALPAARRLSFNGDLARKLLRASWPLIFSSLAIALYMRLDQVMLQRMAGAQEAGLYAAAVKLSELWYLLPTVLVGAAAPTIYTAFAEDSALFERRMTRLFGVLSATALLVMLPVWALSRPLVILLYGQAFAASAAVLSVHIFSAWFVFLGVAQGVWDTANGLQRLALQRTVGGAVLNVGLNLWWIPAHGALGAAWATLLSYAFSATLANLLDVRTRPIFWLQIRALTQWRD